MAAADTARLIASLELDPRKFVAGATTAMGSINRIDKRLGAFSGAVNRNLGRAVDTALSRGIQVGFDAINSGLDHLAERQDVISATTAAIAATGNVAQVSADDIRSLSESLEAASDAFVDDKDIQSAANSLLRFKAVSKDVFSRALTDVVDLGAGMKTGPENAAKLLGKALADPTKAMGALRKAGIVLTDAEGKRIKALVKGNKLNEAQATLLEAVERRYKGAAKAAGGEAADSVNKFNDAVEDTQIALATGLQPAISDLRDSLTTTLADPATQQAIKDLGRNLGDALTKGVAFAKTIPWDKVAAGLQAAAGFAKGVVDAFTSMPPEVQGTIIALAGLNKLSGGAVTGIVGELGKGLIKGVLGMTAGVVNLKAATVIGGGGLGVPGGGNAPGIAPNVGPMGIGAFLGTAGIGAALGTAATALFKGGTDAIADAIGPALGQALRDASEQTRGLVFGPFETIRAALSGEIPGKLQAIADQLGTVMGANKASVTPKNPGEIISDSLGKDMSRINANTADTYTAMLDSKVAAVRSADEIQAATQLGARDVSSTTRSGTSGTTAAVNTARAGIVGAIAANRPIVTTNVEVNVTSTGVQKQTTTSNRFGPSNGSFGGGGGHGGGMSIPS